MYEAYVRRGLARPNPSGLRATPHQLLPTTEVLVAVHHGQVIATISLVRDGKLGLPMEIAYPTEVAALRARGLYLAEVSCLADQRLARPAGVAWSGGCHAPAILMRLMSLMAQCALARGVNQLLIAVRPLLSAVYRVSADRRYS